MHYFNLIAERPLIWGLFIAYLLFTTWLAWLGHKRTTDIESFAKGSGDMNPIVVGITLAASIASTATFVINPGFVYVHGLSALIHLGVAAGSGVIIGLAVMSLGFRRIGAKTRALTLPDWIGRRFDSQGLTVFFAAVNMLSLTFVVLIVGGISIVMQLTLGLTNTESLVLTIGFVFSYIFMGGTYAHAYTNTLQGIIMAVIAVVIVASGFSLLGDGVASAWTTIGTQNPNLVTAINPDSSLFGSFFSVWVAGFVIGFALVSQPHIMIKALYVKDDRDVWRYLSVCVVVSLTFTALLLVGFYAHLLNVPPERFADPTTGLFRQDLVMTVYITEMFSPVMVAVVTVALLSAGMSTLDGILIALSSIAANDLFLNLTRNNLLKNMDDTSKLKAAHKAGQVILIALGLATFFISLHPPKLLGIFGQVGVYGIVAASCAPVLFGILIPRLSKNWVWASAVLGLGTHLSLYFVGSWAAKSGVSLNDMANTSWWGFLADTAAPQLGWMNPGVTATYGIMMSALPMLIFAVVAASSAAFRPRTPRALRKERTGWRVRACWEACTWVAWLADDAQRQSATRAIAVAITTTNRGHTRARVGARRDVLLIRAARREAHQGAWLVLTVEVRDTVDRNRTVDVLGFDRSIGDLR
ncbi:MAG: sodium:solute symporter family protein [bacterium]